MDPFTLQRLAEIRQQEILETAANDREAKPLRTFMSQIGGSLVKVGQRLVSISGEAQIATPEIQTEAAGNC
jgi:hypothetical protein